MKPIEDKVKGTTPTLVLFQKSEGQEYAELKKLMDELTAKFGDKLHIIDYDCSHNGQPKEKYRFTEYPTWILFKEGLELQRESGHKTIAQLEDMVVRAM
ncbi:MAG: hypothetical protein K2H32_00025 [Muribaculaceae bacterium]|nr:hypothetical protein [Muribaculaceae bacterium]MDE5856741.1 hypothetical protein [Muribaculaceae bacterium]MDE7368677.1 hypothetical protein [Muribaculaceae bacterium]